MSSNRGHIRHEIFIYGYTTREIIRVMEVDTGNNANKRVITVWAVTQYSFTSIMLKSER